jgi:hypothetical protein
MAISRAIGRVHLSGRDVGTFSDPAQINAPVSSVQVEVSNFGDEPFFVRLNDNTLQTDWVRVTRDREASLLLATTSTTYLEFARQRLSTPRFISSRHSNENLSVTPILAEINFPAVDGSGSSPPTCCSTTNTDLEIVGSANGVILESPNGKRWRLNVLNTGAISATALP